MKLTIPLCLLALTAFAVETPKQEPLLIGRYQLVAAKVLVVDKNNLLREESRVFRLDTATGKTAVFTSWLTEDSVKQEFFNYVPDVQQLLKPNPTKGE